MNVLTPLGALLLAVPLMAGCGVGGGAPVATPSVTLAGDGVVVVRPGDSGAVVARALEAAGVVSSSAFLALAATDSRSDLIQPGEYRLGTNLTATEALDGLLGGERTADRVVVVLPGMRAAEVAELTAEATDASVAEARAAFRVDGCQSSLDGLLGPATYHALPGDIPSVLAAQMVDAGHEALAVAEQLAPTAGRSARDLVVIASILQAELHPQDWAKGAAVIGNRLAAGMPLQLDSTAAYASCASDVELTADQMQVTSEFNTYTVTGLPPAPIGQVSVDAVEAAARPAAGTWLYWVTVDLDTGLTRFSTDYEQFLADKQVLRSWLAEHRG